jgi:hypothetical protein
VVNWGAVLFCQDLCSFRVPGVYLSRANHLFVALFSLSRISNLRIFNAAFSPIWATSTNRLPANRQSPSHRVTNSRKLALELIQKLGPARGKNYLRYEFHGQNKTRMCFDMNRYPSSSLL